MDVEKNTLESNREILKRLPMRELLQSCQTNKYTWNEVCDDNFIRDRLISEYPGAEKYKPSEQTWKQYFLSTITYVDIMKRNSNYQYTTGDPKKQYILLSKYNLRRSSDQGELLIEAAREGELPLVKFAIKTVRNWPRYLKYKQDALNAAGTRGEQGNLDVVLYLHSLK
jgi:hypothetical protein